MLRFALSCRLRLRLKLRCQTVDLHLEVLVVTKGSDQTLNELAHRLHRLALPDADAETVIIGGSVDWQRDMRWKPRLERLFLSRLEPLWVK